jgi:guanine deaminase
MSSHEDFMKKACQLGELGVSNGGGPFGCVIVDSNKNIVGRVHNMVTINNDPTQHAENVAIRDACKKLNTYDLSGCTMYTSCENCAMCLAASYWAHIESIHYGNTRQDSKAIGFDDDFIYDEVSKHIDNRTIPMTQCDRESAQISFQQWVNKSDKTLY